MATTYELIAKNVLGSDTASVTFSSIPGTYTDLLIECSLRDDSATTQRYALLAFNGTSTTARQLYAFDGAAYSATGAGFIRTVGNNATSNTFGSGSIYVPNYAGSQTKTFSATSVTEHNSSTGAVIFAAAGTCDITAAITSVTFSTDSPNYMTGSSVYLYGITKA